MLSMIMPSVSNSRNRIWIRALEATPLRNAQGVSPAGEPSCSVFRQTWPEPLEGDSTKTLMVSELLLATTQMLTHSPMAKSQPPS